MIRPSSLPMVDQCPLFTGRGSDFAEAGTSRHTALSATITGDKAAAGITAALPEDEGESITWAAEYIKSHASTAQWPLITETMREWDRPDFTRARGTPDYICGPDLFDLKWRRRNYRPQMADYALSIFAEHPEFERVNVHILFGADRHVEAYTLTQEQAEDEVMAVLRKAGTGEPNPCDYCGWCSRAVDCPPLIKQAGTVAHGYSPDPRVQNWHPSKMETGEEIAYALWIWRTHLSKWGASIEHQAKEAALKKGLTLSCSVETYEPKSKKGKKYCADVAGAFPLSGLPQADFLKCCDLRLATSKKYKDKVGLSNLYAQLHGMKLAPAKRELLEKLATALKTTNESVSLCAVKSGADEDEE